MLTLPGLTPQGLQGSSDLLRQQGQANAYKNAYGQVARGSQKNQSQPLPPKNSLQDVRFGNFAPQTTQNPQQERGQPLGQAQVVPKGPTSPELKTRMPWTPEERDQETGKVWNLPQNAGKTYPEIQQIVNDNESRYLKMPEAEQKEYKRLEGELDDATNRFQESLQTKLEKTNVEGVYKDITGENLAALERELDTFMAKHPEISKNDAADIFSKKALDLAKSKSNLQALSSEGGLSRFLKQGQTLDKLKGYEKTFKETGNSEEYHNILKSDFGMSPQGSSSIAFPLSSKVKGYIENHKPVKYKDPLTISKSIENSKKLAVNLFDLIDRNDSPLSLAKSLKNANPNFNENVFLNYFREKRDLLSPIQQRLLDEGESDLFPNWGDLSILPLIR